jgi:hypothetical protein
MIRTRFAHPLVFLSLTTLCACVHSKPTYLADGKPGYAIRCDSFTTNWASCLVRAGKMCRKAGYSVSYADEVNRELLIECGSAVTHE